MNELTHEEKDAQFNQQAGAILAAAALQGIELSKEIERVSGIIATTVSPFDQELHAAVKKACVQVLGVDGTSPYFETLKLKAELERVKAQNNLLANACQSGAYNVKDLIEANAALMVVARAAKDIDGQEISMEGAPCIAVCPEYVQAVQEAMTALREKGIEIK